MRARISIPVSALPFLVVWLAAASAEDIRFPADAGVIDVTRPPYRASGDGRTDDTTAIQQALYDYPAKNRIIYLPNGTYLVSDTLRWGPKDARSGRLWRPGKRGAPGAPPARHPGHCPLSDRSDGSEPRCHPTRRSRADCPSPRGSSPRRRRPRRTLPGGVPCAPTPSLYRDLKKFPA